MTLSQLRYAINLQQYDLIKKALRLELIDYRTN
jgi:hypothetical protein